MRFGSVAGVRKPAGVMSASAIAGSRFLRLAAVAALLALPIGASVLAAGAPATHTVTIDGTRYEPATLTVNRGDTVVWINKDPFPHTVTAAPIFDSGSIAAGARWSYTARKAGDFAYICTLHPNMAGRLVVR